MPENGQMLSNRQEDEKNELNLTVRLQFAVVIFCEKTEEETTTAQEKTLQTVTSKLEMITIRFRSKFPVRKLVLNLHQITQILLKKQENQFGIRSIIIIIITETRAEIRF